MTSTGLQIIGVDPSTDQIISWSFPSTGGHAMGYWAPHGNGWIVESSGVMKDGTETSSITIKRKRSPRPEHKRKPRTTINGCRWASLR